MSPNLRVGTALTPVRVAPCDHGLIGWCHGYVLTAGAGARAKRTRRDLHLLAPRKGGDMLRRSDALLDDGYYLSAYLTTPGAAHLLSTATRHDNSVALWRKSGN